MVKGIEVGECLVAVGGGNGGVVEVGDGMEETVGQELSRCSNVKTIGQHTVPRYPLAGIFLHYRGIRTALK